MNDSVIGIDIGSGPEYAGEIIWAYQDGRWVIESMRTWEVNHG